MTRANTDIREAAKSARVYLWQIAERYGIADCNFSRILRKPLSEQERKKIMVIIQDLRREGQMNG